tara:strand:- start:4699 stop:5328 length:630 start_codon:yes stop_codon:yes gene_type:complete
MPTTLTGRTSITYGNFSHNESSNITLDDYADSTAGKVKNYNSCDRRVEDPATGSEISYGDIDEANIGLTIIKNMNAYGDLHVDINYSSSFSADLIIPAGGFNVIHPNCSADAPRVKCPTAQATGVGVTSATAAGLITFDGDRTIGTAYIASTANPGGGANFIIKISAARTGTLYELDGVTIKDMSSAWGGTTEVTLDYFVDYRCTVTEV